MMQADVTILGGGLVGSILAVGLAYRGLKIVVLDHNPPLDFKDSGDGRTTAVSYGSQQIFHKLGLWDGIACHAQPICEIRVFEEGSAWTVDYDHKDIGPHPMGYILENRVMRHHLQQALKHPQITWLTPSSALNCQRLFDKAVITTTTGEVIESKLIVGAEGRHSPVRLQSGIGVHQWDYPQTALVAHIYHQEPHHNTAWEIFMPSGPLAVLPMLTCPQTQQHRSGLVWAKSRDYDWHHPTNQDLEKEFLSYFPFYGSISLCSERWTYPLSALKVDSFVAHRLALVGDAAHVVHPIAGQGVNLGWRDADVLTTLLGDAFDVGLDIGTLSVLKSYHQKQKLDHCGVLWMTDGINRLFRSPYRSTYFLRNAGFAVVNHLPPLKRWLMRKAMGI